MIDRWDEYLRSAYRSSLGRRREELVTPALIVDLGLVKENIRFMMEQLGTMHAKLRPHIKCQKCAELARMQVEAGAIGVCAATVWEAIVMIHAGIEDVLIVNEVGGEQKIKALAGAAREHRLTVAVDDKRNASDLSEAACAAGSRLDVLIEIDVGMGRGGVRSSKEAVELAQHVDTLKALRLRGVQGYEGHCMQETDHGARERKVKEALAYVHETVDRLAAAGFACEVVSAGGTGTYDITAAVPFVTEIQAGSYVFMDNFHANQAPGFQCALTVLGTVVIEHGNTIVFDSGRKSIGIDYILPTLAKYPQYRARYFAEEHAVFDVDDACPLALGDTAELVPGYAPTTVNLYDVYHVVENDVVVDVWPIIPRGGGHAGILE